MRAENDQVRWCDQGCGYRLPSEYAANETTCGACLNDLENGFGNESACANCGDEWSQLDRAGHCGECAAVFAE